jgi:hypothetical protein
LKKRLCSFCKFEIPFEAIVCGHCTRSIPIAVVENHCDKHNIMYHQEIYVETGKPVKGGCSKCIGDMQSEIEDLTNS